MGLFSSNSSYIRTMNSCINVSLLRLMCGWIQWIETGTNMSSVALCKDKHRIKTFFFSFSNNSVVLCLHFLLSNMGCLYESYSCLMCHRCSYNFIRVEYVLFILVMKIYMWLYYM